MTPEALQQWTDTWETSRVSFVMVNMLHGYYYCYSVYCCQVMVSTDIQMVSSTRESGSMAGSMVSASYTVHHTPSYTGQGKLTLGDNGYYQGSFVHGEIEGHGFRLFGLTGSTYTGILETSLCLVRCVCSQVSSIRERCMAKV